MVMLLYCGDVAGDTFFVMSENILRHASGSGWQDIKAQSDGLFSEAPLASSRTLPQSPINFVVPICLSVCLRNQLVSHQEDFCEI